MPPFSRFLVNAPRSTPRCARPRAAQIVVFIGTLLASWLVAAPAVRAQDCQCDHELQPGPQVVVGSELGVKPGERICVMAGEYEFIRFKGVVGSAAEPVTILNCGGLVRIHNDDRGYALVFEDDDAGISSKYFHITGTGHADLKYGFEISAPAVKPWPGFGISLVGRSTNYEVDHIEIHDTGFAGISAKTDPVCDGSADQDRFVQRDIEFHHLYVHDTGGEAFYIGSTQTYGQTITCDGQQVVHQPHFLEGVSVHHNLIENTAWDGVQIGMARADCAFYGNTIRNVGLAGVQYQQQGLQIGGFTSCEVYANVLLNGPTNGIFVMGAQDSRFYNNLVVGFGGDGIYMNYGNGGDAAAGATYAVHFNTVVDYGRNGIRAHSDKLGAVIAKNNLVVGPEGQLAPGNEVNWEAANNLAFTTREEARFVGGDDFQLADDSAARGAGVPIEGIDSDLAALQRSDPPSVGAYEHVADSPGPVPGGVGPPPPTGAPPSGVGDGDSGGCSAAGPGRGADGTPLAGLLVLLVLLAWSRLASLERGETGSKSCAQTV